MIQQVRCSSMMNIVVSTFSRTGCMTNSIGGGQEHTCRRSTSCSMYDDTCSLTGASGNQLLCTAPFIMLRTVCSSDR